MIAIDLYHKIKHTGNFMTWVGLADFHMLCDSDDKEAYQPLDYDAYVYFKHCADEITSNLTFYGKPMFYSAGDLTELERSSIRKGKRSFMHKNDTRAEDTIHKHIIREHIIPKLKNIVGKNTFVGGVAGNHMIEFCDQKIANNSEEYIINLLGGKYFGEAKMLVNLHLELGSSRVLKRILITHGDKAGSKISIMKELQQIHSLYGDVAMVIKAHAHDPMTHFHCRYKIPDLSTGTMKRTETLVMCLGSTRDGEKLGYDDYVERGNYTPVAARYPMAILHAYKPKSGNGALDIKFRPYIM